jgi:hypothetical protein
MEVVDKDIKITIINMLGRYQEVKKNMNVMTREMKDKERHKF